MAKATHRGECQVCGARQLLPGGKLSKHGYTVRWGTFSGVCPGAHHLPFEQSKDLIERAIERASHQRDIDLEEAIRLEDRPTTPATWVHVYLGSTRTGASYRWMEGTAVVERESKTHANGHTFTVTHKRVELKGSYRNSRGREVTVEDLDLVAGFYGVENDLDLAEELNAKRASWLRKQASECERYIGWQRSRIASWKPRELEARTAA